MLTSFPPSTSRWCESGTPTNRTSVEVRRENIEAARSYRYSLVSTIPCSRKRLGCRFPDILNWRFCALPTLNSATGFFPPATNAANTTHQHAVGAPNLFGLELAKSWGAAMPLLGALEASDRDACPYTSTKTCLATGR